MEHLNNSELLNIIFSESESDEEALLLKIILDDNCSESDIENPPKKKRKCWVRPYNTDRDETGAFQDVFIPLKISDPELFYSYMRMTFSQFDELLSQIGPAITKQDFIRKAIGPSARLAITLRYLATGESPKSLSTAYKCTPANVHSIVKETTAAIIEALKPKVFKKINTETFLDVANGFKERWNFPHCIGAIDGKHVSIQAPSYSHNGSTFYNYKKFYSIVLMAICDHDYNFLMCEIGAAGRQSDGSIFRNSKFRKQFNSNSLPLPHPSNLSDRITEVPYVFVADDAFGLDHNIIKPYSKNPLTMEQKIFNYRLSRAHQIIENCFGILVTKWRIFRQPIIANIDTAENIIGACVCLHNWLRQHSSPTRYISKELVDTDHSDGTFTDGIWRNESNDNIRGMKTKAYNSTKEAKQIRDKFADYFYNEGAVSWQKEKI